MVACSRPPAPRKTRWAERRKKLWVWGLTSWLAAGAYAADPLAEMLRPWDDLITRQMWQIPRDLPAEDADWLLSVGAIGNSDEQKDTPRGQRLKEILVLRGFCQRVDSLTGCIRRAQTSLGLGGDGIASKQLYLNLALPAGERLALLRQARDEFRQALEHVRQRAGKSGKALVVNLPSFTLWAVDFNSGKISLSSPVIIGRPDRPTPTTPIRVVGLKYNPTWTPSSGIIEKDILPRLGRDPVWFEKHGVVILDAEGNEVNPAAVSLRNYAAGGYRFRQPASEKNALGVLKFETDSKDDIYLHDTNERSLFTRAQRARSSGCIRVKEWRGLGSFLSGKEPPAVDAEIEKGKTWVERVAPVPVEFTYLLAEPVNGRLVVWPDIYARKKDKRWVPGFNADTFKPPPPLDVAATKPAANKNSTLQKN